MAREGSGVGYVFAQSMNRTLSDFHFESGLVMNGATLVKRCF